MQNKIRSLHHLRVVHVSHSILIFKICNKFSFLSSNENQNYITNQFCSSVPISVTNANQCLWSYSSISFTNATTTNRNIDWSTDHFSLSPIEQEKQPQTDSIGISHQSIQIDPTVTYQHRFVFLRQLAVHLHRSIQNRKPVNFLHSYWREYRLFYFYQSTIVPTIGNLFIQQTGRNMKEKSILIRWSDAEMKRSNGLNKLVNNQHQVHFFLIPSNTNHYNTVKFSKILHKTRVREYRWSKKNFVIMKTGKNVFKSKSNENRMILKKRKKMTRMNQENHWQKSKYLFVNQRCFVNLFSAIFQYGYGKMKR